MVDEQKNTSGDDEYQFPQEEYVGTTESPEAPAAETASAASGSSEGGGFRKKVIEGYGTSVSARNKRIVIILVVLVCILLLPKIISLFYTSKKNTVHAVTPKPTQPVEQPQPQQQLPVVTPQPVITPPSDDSLDEVRAYHSQADSKIQELQSKVENVEHSLVQSEATNEQLQKSITQLTSQVQALSVQLKQTIAQEKKAPKTKKVNFYLRAVVPDRAWVMTSSGETVSVSIGDSLDQYGTIQSIDPVYGVIQTSSGRKITYGSNDY